MGRHRTLAAHITTALLAALLSACAVGPDYVRPDVDAVLPQAQAFVHADPVLTAATATETQFWQRLGDPLLASLVEDALRDNHDLRIALARLDRARALLRETGFDRLPTLTASASSADVRAAASEAPGAPRDARDGERHHAGIEAFWEADVFGRVRRAVEADRAGRDAAAADLAALQVAVAGDVARNYFLLRGLQAQLQVAKENAGNQQGSLRLVQARLDAGRGTAFDTARSRALLESTLARIPALQAELAATAHRIAVLTGREPTALLDTLAVVDVAGATDTQLARLPSSVAIGTPEDLLQRHPQVAAAERRLAAATARIGVATADLYPRFTLTGLLGTQALDTGALFERDSEQRLVALGIDWSFLDIGRVRARIAAADADAAGNLAAFQQVVLRALEDAENALVRYSRAERERMHLAAAAQASDEATALAHLRFEGGVVGFLDVLDAERVELEAEERLAQARTRQATALVDLYSALAGGWPEHAPARVPLAAAPR